MKKHIILAGAIMLLIFLGAGAWARERQGSYFAPVQRGNITIVLAEEGFTPQEVHVRVGTTVTFTTTTGNFFWPASDLHPSHSIYPAFDPKKPIGANESWSFTFDRVGNWEFHDHLSPYFTGTISVVE